MPLRNPANDARAVAKALEATGFEVLLRINSDQAQMIEAANTFGNGINGGVGLFYFAGHGVQFEGENYLMPIDAQIQKEHQIKYQAVNANLFLDEMNKAQSRVSIAILDLAATIPTPVQHALRCRDWPRCPSKDRSFPSPPLPAKSPWTATGNTDSTPRSCSTISRCWACPSKRFLKKYSPTSTTSQRVSSAPMSPRP